MSSGRIQSRESIALAQRVFRAFGHSWAAVKRASVYEDGVWKIKRSAIPDSDSPPVKP